MARGGTGDLEQSVAPQEAPRPTQRSLKRRYEIARKAAVLFADGGYHEIGMREIAESVGIQAPSIYKHFSSKEEIIYYIALLMTKQFAEDVLPVFETPCTAVQRIEMFVETHIRKLAANRLEHLVSSRELSALTPVHRAEVSDIRRYYQRRLRDVIAYGVKSGDFVVESPSLASVAIMDMMNGMSWWLGPESNIDEIVGYYVEHVVRGVLGHSKN